MAAALADACTRNCNCTDVIDLLHDIVYEGGTDSWNDIAGYYFSYRPWVFSLLGSTMVGLTGIFPLWLIPIQDGADLKTGENGGTLKILLSFAVGALLGDVFLHLLPETFENDFQRRAEDGHASMPAGFWILCAFLFFVIFEKSIATLSEEAPTIPEQQADEKDANRDKEMDNNNCITITSTENAKNGFAKGYLKSTIEVQTFMEKRSSGKNGFVQIPNDIKDSRKNGLFHAKFFDPQAFPGYLNLLMNFLDNFTHGLSVGGSFLISFRVGVLSTFTILVHEIPHEVGDFAILLRSGFSRWDAARAQLMTAGGGIVGALAAVLFSGGLEERTNWILPLTAGGFIHIGLVTILPDLLKETNTKESLKQLGSILFGVVIMAALMRV